MSESVSIYNSINPVDKFKLVPVLKYLHAVQKSVVSSRDYATYSSGQARLPEVEGSV